MALDLLKKLLKFKSITPNDDEALDYIASYMKDFKPIFIEKNGIKNLLLTKDFRSKGEHLAFGGHIDVVPPGNGWDSDPFDPIIKNDLLYARGAADMKSGVAAFLTACKEADFKGAKLSIILTSDEEGEAKYGTLEVLKYMQNKNILPHFAIVAEPSSNTRFGDSIKIGRRGSINGHLSIKGIQGHVAYPQKCDNPIHKIAKILDKLVSIKLDKKDKYFPLSKLIITDIKSGLGVCNVTPSDLQMMFNIRHSNKINIAYIKDRLKKILNGLDYELILTQGAKPFLTNPNNKIIKNLSKSIYKITKIKPSLNTKGGTSDARFFAEFGVDVTEFGVINDSIHSANEYVNIHDFTKLCLIFKDLIENF